jgi:hypothetical protein
MKLINGKCQVIIRSSGNSGLIKLKVYADNLSPALLTVSTQQSKLLPIISN